MSAEVVQMKRQPGSRIHVSKTGGSIAFYLNDERRMTLYWAKGADPANGFYLSVDERHGYTEKRRPFAMNKDSVGAPLFTAMVVGIKLTLALARR